MEQCDVTGLADRARRPPSGLRDFVRRHAQLQSADVLLRHDHRPPIIYLRSFDDDLLRLAPPTRFERTVISRLQQWNSQTGESSEFEAGLLEGLRPLGPVIAAARPAYHSSVYADLNRRYGEPIERTDRLHNTYLEWRQDGKMKASRPVPLAPLGARRAYLPLGRWQAAVREWLEKSSLVVIVIGGGEGLAWELHEVVRQRLLDRCIVVVPPHWRAVFAVPPPPGPPEVRAQYDRWRDDWWRHWMDQWWWLRRTLAGPAGPTLPPTIDVRAVLAVVPGTGAVSDDGTLVVSRWSERADYRAAMNVAVESVRRRPSPSPWAEPSVARVPPEHGRAAGPQAGE